MQLAGTVRTLVRFVAFVLCVLALTATSRAETPIPPPPPAWVTDAAGLLSAQTVQEQNARLEAYERSSGHQILVYIAPTTGGTPIDDWAVRAFAKWKVGRKNLDDGLVLFIFAKDHALRIEVGYGLEGTVPDVLASRIIRDTIAPGLKAGQPDSAVTAGIDRILQLTGGATATAAPQTDAQDNASPLQLTPIELILIAILVIGFIILAIRSPSTALFLLVTIMSRGGSGGGGSYGGGGFSGGGGRSGGGGASGTW